MILLANTILFSL